MRRIVTYFCRRFLIKHYIVAGVGLLLFLWLMSHKLSTDHHVQEADTHERILNVAQAKVPDKEDTAVTMLSTEQSILRNIAKTMEIHYQVVQNEPANNVLIQITNTGKEGINNQLQWKLYFHQVPILKKVTSNSGDTINFGHVGGSLYYLEMVNKFSLLPEKSATISLINSSPTASRSDIYPNWYVHAEGLMPEVIRNTADETLAFVGPFETRLNWNRGSDDLYKPFTLQERYDENKKVYRRDNREIKLNVIPTPRHMTVRQNEVNIKGWTIHFSGLMEEAIHLAKKLSLTANYHKPDDKYISLSLWDGKSYGKMYDESPEAYYLDVDHISNTIVIIGRTNQGVFWGIQTLLSLTDDQLMVKEVTIKDSPRFAYRGFMLDVVRNFHPKKEVFKILDLMCMYKLNKLHLHLTDDENWRLEIPGLEELTEVGARRCHDLSEDKCLLPQLGSDPNIPNHGTGFYSVEDYKDILLYAKTRSIEVIPEFDLPGHSRAAIKSMEARARKYRNEPEKSGQFLLSDPEDKSKYMSFQNFNDNVANPCLESTYRFVEHIVSSIVDMHKGVSPLKVFHMGGDEVPKNALKNSPACQRLRKDKPAIRSDSDIKAYFVNRVSDITMKYKLSLAGWEDGFLRDRFDPFPDLKNKREQTMYAYAWKNKLDWGTAKHSYELANAGYMVILSHATHLYLDHAHEPDPEERGAYWATRYISPFKTFSHLPDNAYENSQFTNDGKPITQKEIQDCIQAQHCPPLIRPENIVGVQAQVWCEVLRTSQQLESMIAPRLLSFAERAWHKADWEKVDNRDLREPLAIRAWRQFAHNVGNRELPRLNKMNFEYYIPPPGAVIDGGLVKMNAMFPGLNIVYSSDNGMNWNKYTETSQVLMGTYLLATESQDGRRRSRIVKFDSEKL